MPSLGLAARYNWNPPFQTYLPIIGFFFLSNVFLVFAPLVPPAAGFQPYEHLPYWVSSLHYLVAALFKLASSSSTYLRVFRSLWSGWCIGMYGVDGFLDAEGTA